MPQTHGPMLQILPLWLGYGVLGLYFWLGRDGARKRQLWPWYVIGAGLFFLWIGWRIGAFPQAAAFLVPAVAVVTFLNLRSTTFCERCGKMIRRGVLGRGDLFCSGCGVKIGDKQ